MQSLPPSDAFDDQLDDDYTFDEPSPPGTRSTITPDFVAPLEKLARRLAATQGSASETPLPEPDVEMPPIDTPCAPASPDQLTTCDSISAQPQSPTEDEFNEPYWIPIGVALHEWPPELRARVAALINPTYKQLVMCARPGLEQSTGLSIVHMLWLEILDHLEICRKPTNEPYDPLQLFGPEPRGQAIERQMRLVKSKLNASDFLLRLERFRLHRRNTVLEQHDDYYDQPARPKRLHEYGKNDFC